MHSQMPPPGTFVPASGRRIVTDAEALARTLREVHGRYARYRNALDRSSGHVWQNRYYSCAVEEVALGGVVGRWDRRVFLRFHESLISLPAASTNMPCFARACREGERRECLGPVKTTPAERRVSDNNSKVSSQTATYASCNALNRLVTAQTGAWTQTNGYDRYGNRWVQDLVNLPSDNEQTPRAGGGVAKAGEM